MAESRKQSARPRTQSVEEPPPPPYDHSPAIARSKQVQVFRRGNDIVLRGRPAKLSELLAALPPLADDAFPDAIPDVPPEPVEGF
jgi:hypothetical protein